MTLLTYVFAIIGIFFVLPWYIAIKRASGNKRHKKICQFCMVINFLIIAAIMFSAAILMLGERNDLLGYLAFSSCVLIPIFIGPVMGIKFFTFLYKEKLGDEGVEQACSGRE